MQAVNINSRSKIVNGYIYTYHLPFGVRRNICDILDADQSWQTLGGQFMHLDATQLKLIGQALLRNESPTEELLHKLDSANIRISELVYYMAQMGHIRALEILKPYVIDTNSSQQQQQHQPGARHQANSGGDHETAAIGSLNTPTPSFSSIQPMAIMNPSELNLISPSDYQNQNPDDWTFVEQYNDNNKDLASSHNNNINNKQLQASSQPPPPTKCHNTNYPQQQQQQQYQEMKAYQENGNATISQDPGEEIVRMACANNRKRTSISDQEVVNQLRLIMQITYNELKQASNDFADSNILGNGGFASVYRGYWKGTDVAIKRLRCNLMDQAMNELTILNSYRIDNILPIYGISIDGPEACLVYQFMANGSLEDRLSCKNGTPPLTWDQRAAIAEGVAKGLYYLHTLRNKPLVHGDAKSANVLLDSQFVPKLGDFGLARQVFRGRNPQTDQATHCTVSSIHGTSVYLPPEYLRHKILSPAVDAYSYGIVLLEMATGKRAYDGKRLLIDYVEDEMKLMPGGQVNYNLKDFRLPDDTHYGGGELKICFELLLRLGLNCAHRVKKRRPDMGQVLNHFAQFRLNGSTSPNIDTNLLMSGLSTTPLMSNATTRTLTPELTPTMQHDNPFRATFGFQQQQQQQHQQQQQQPRQPANAFRQNSTLLMSVDEEQEFPQHQDDNILNNQNAHMLPFHNNQQQQLEQHQQQQQQQQQQFGQELEHQHQQQEPSGQFIPLLTELGFTAQPD
uniref:non-specific serine/threonine protein kinase n=1 Tax=Aceria tosichella TaxID=561515 RepID=A0A6G1SDJ6_9ACAR